MKKIKFEENSILNQHFKVECKVSEIDLFNKEKNYYNKNTIRIRNRIQLENSKKKIEKENYNSLNLIINFSKLNEIPEFFFGQNFIKILNLKNNNIKIINPNLNTIFYKLKILNLKENKIKIIKNFFQKIPNLEKLDISFNYLCEFPVEITLLKNLQILKINNNFINFLPVEFVKLKNLKLFTINWPILINKSKYIINDLSINNKFDTLKNYIKLIDFFELFKYYNNLNLNDFLEYYKFDLKNEQKISITFIENIDENIKNEIDNNNKSIDKFTVNALTYNRYKQAKYILKNKQVDLNIGQNSIFGTPLHICIRKIYCKLYKYFIKNELEVNNIDFKMNNYLHLLFQNNNLKNKYNMNLLKFLLKKKIKLNSLNYDLDSPLNIGVKHNNNYIIKFIIKYNKNNEENKDIEKFDLFLKNSDNLNCLLLSIIYNKIKIFIYLVNYDKSLILLINEKNIFYIDYLEKSQILLKKISTNFLFNYFKINIKSYLEINKKTTDIDNDEPWNKNYLNNNLFNMKKINLFKNKNKINKPKIINYIKTNFKNKNLINFKEDLFIKKYKIIIKKIKDIKKKIENFSIESNILKIIDELRKLIIIIRPIYVIHIKIKNNIEYNNELKNYFSKISKFKQLINTILVDLNLKINKHINELKQFKLKLINNLIINFSNFILKF